MEEYLTIKESDLKELLDFQAKVLVGKALKRFELHQNLDVIKKEVKELIYEQFRQVDDLIYSYDKGLKIRQFKFVSEKEAPAT